ncbi:MAG: hypothetical protein F6K54_27065 [Okeania sp. SIO3B5]|uniref:hypothetical protein n=1 Tax=Okeania sp. SIO3B5 TaxID=2607811 RepID=UPI0014010B3B|nr:hypothetical protein [Okeania sp. SIO3B5]NEO56424.1 hypothetical protein [Okeania sp. SIO3B5]
MRVIFNQQALSIIVLFVVGISFIFGAELIILKCNRLELKQKIACEVTHFCLRGKRITVIPAGMLQGVKKERISHKKKRI